MTPVSGAGSTRCRLVFDISILALQGGQAVGILRVVRELARWANAHVGGVSFVFFDRETQAFRTFAGDWLDAVIEGRALVDVSTRADPARPATMAERAPRFLRPPALWLRNPRRRAIVAIERARIGGWMPPRWADGLIGRLMSSKDRRALSDPAGLRRRLLPFAAVAGDLFKPADGDIMLYAGSDWSPAEIAWVRRAKASADVRLVFVSYDIIALMFPSFFPAARSALFREMFDAVVVLADLVMVTAHVVADDVGRYCAQRGLPAPRTAVFRLGSDLVGGAGGRLPQGLMSGHYALFVSTIEPRKNHRLLVDVWRLLLKEGVPQRHGFKLVFVGRRGWMVDALMADIEGDAGLRNTLLVLDDVSDSGLVTLYRHAAFTLFPSRYEGYGLPVVESFRNGKAVLASNGGALAEIVGSFSPTLEPDDTQAWLEHMRRWIVQPEAREPYEAAIRERYAHPDWDAAAAAFFDILFATQEDKVLRREGGDA